MLRLFRTGDLEEARLIADLERIGVKCQAVDPETGRQWKISALGGHLKGHMDGKAVGIIEAPKTEHLLEFKTHNEKSFRALVKDGVEKSKPGHFAQMQLYMHFGHLERAFYLAVNKNTDELHGERVKYDAAKALILLARAENIIRASEPPPKLHEDPESKAAWQCRFCSARPQCHESTMARANCRTCLHASVVDGGWHCAAQDRMLSIEEQRIGCSRHLFIPALVPGEQIDADEAKETVTYRMVDGSIWVDGGQE
ncbi:MAG: oxidoreductase [Pseudomonadota bacterium]